MRSHSTRGSERTRVWRQSNAKGWAVATASDAVGPNEGNERLRVYAAGGPEPRITGFEGPDRANEGPGTVLCRSVVQAAAPEDPKAKHIGWTRTFVGCAETLFKQRLPDEFIGDESRELVRAAFGSNNRRLVDLKTKYDPTNFFSLNQNVEPWR